jgi:WD40 repeat protein
VCDVAERLKKDGLRVWFDAWELKSGDSIQAKIEDGLERSRVLVLCMSAHAFGSDWAQLEAGTFRFRDPMNKERRFIPLRLDDAPIKGSLVQFLSINWHPESRKQEYPRLLDACRPPARPPMEEAQAAREQFEEKMISRGHTGPVNSVAISPDGRYAFSGSDDKTVRLWDVDGGHCLRVFEGHTGRVERGVEWRCQPRLFSRAQRRYACMGRNEGRHKGTA